MSGLVWIVPLALAAVLVGTGAWLLRRSAAMKRKEAARIEAFLAQSAGIRRGTEAGPLPVAAGAAVPAVPAATGDGLSTQKLLFEAGHKAGEAGEPALAIQLYARLLARFPHCAFAAQARGAIESQKRKLSKG